MVGVACCSLAAREADIVNVNFDLREGHVNRNLVRTGLAEATDEKLGWIKDAAGDRLDRIELSVTIFLANITDDRESVATAMAAGVGVGGKGHTGDAAFPDRDGR